jgi:hypothetical protein
MLQSQYKALVVLNHVLMIHELLCHKLQTS